MGDMEMPVMYMGDMDIQVQGRDGYVGIGETWMYKYKEDMDL